jgi:hypothetical protein
MGEHHRRIEAVAPDRTVAGDLHVAHHAQALDLRIQRAQPVGKLLRQHRDHAARKIHRVAARIGVPVQRAARRHIVRNIGNRHDQAEALALALAIHGVVEVPAVSLSMVTSGRPVMSSRPFQSDLRTASGSLRVSASAALENSYGQFVLAQRDLDFHARIGIVAEHFDQAADRL